MKRQYLILLSVTICILALTSCAERQMGHAGDPAFVRGLIDGLLAPITFVVSLFSETVRMYQFPNIGRWYDFGFLLGLSAWGSGGSHVVTRYVYIDRRQKDDA